MSIFTNLKTATKLAILMITSGLALIAVVTLLLSSQHKTLYEDRLELLSSQVDVAYSLVNSFYQASKTGSVSEDEAKQQAIHALNNLRYQTNEYFFTILQKDVTLIQHPHLPKLIGTQVNNVEDVNGLKLFQEFKESVINDTKRGQVDYYWNKPGDDVAQPKSSFLALFEPWGWTIGTGVYTDDIRNAFIEDLIGIILVIAAIFAGTSALAYVISIDINRPLKSLEQTIEAVSKTYDLTLRSQVDNDSETGHIAKSANRLFEMFQSSCQSMFKTALKVRQESLTLSTSATNTHKAVGHQTQQIEQIATAMNQMSATVDEVARNTENANIQTQAVDGHAQQGQTVLTQTTQQVSRLASEVESIGESITSLQVETQGIGDIVGVITGIADQTNLLALNAAIEAARAGEQGRGFAVVADEVRSLASKTQESTEEIRSKIESLQQGSHTAMSRMKEGEKQAKESETRIQEVHATFQDIVNTVDDLATMIAQISTAANQQSAVADEINRNISEVNSAAKGTNEQASQIEKIAGNLSGQAEAMNKMLGQFKL